MFAPRLSRSQRLRCAVRVTAASRTAATGLLAALIFVGLAASPGGRAQRSIYIDLLDRSSAYVAQYEKALSAVVAEEQYVQRVTVPRAAPRGAGPRPLDSDLKGAPAPGVPGGYQRILGGEVPRAIEEKTRHMLSDVLMVQLPNRVWIGFRDVIEVDGRKVRNREDRLRELFLKSAATHKKITDESARYNIGTIERTLNLPTFALQYLHPDLIDHFSFRPDREEMLEERESVVFSFRETARPTMVQTSDGKNMPTEDLPSAGLMWIDRRTGGVLKTELVLLDVKERVEAVITVTYAPDPTLGQLLPAEMRERYTEPAKPLAAVIECEATYSKFRRFTVQTEEKIQVPKDIKQRPLSPS